MKKNKILDSISRTDIKLPIKSDIFPIPNEIPNMDWSIHATSLFCIFYMREREIVIKFPLTSSPTPSDEMMCFGPVDDG
jgi:hypothetical protein